MPTKRILIFSLAYYPMVGGAEVAIKELTDRLTEYEFDMVTLRFDKTHASQERIGNVHVYRIGGGFGYLSKILFIPDAAAFAWTMHRKQKYDGLWAMMTYMTFPVVMARFLGLNVPYVLTLQDGDPFEQVFERKRIFLVKPLLSLGFKWAKVVQPISNFLASWARKLGAKGSIEVIPNGVDIERFVGEARPLGEEVKLITTSRLVEKNGIGDVIAALPLLPQNVKFEILGSGPLEDELRKQVEDLHLEMRVKFRNFISQTEVPSCLHNADIFIRPALSEGQGISFIEAMAAGLPVIATNVGGIPDFITDRETGLFVNVHDPKDIAEKVKELIENGELRFKLIENGKKLAQEKYDWKLLTEMMKKRVFEPLFNIAKT